MIVSLDKQWFFEAQSNEERDEWVQAIEQQILCSIQNIESSKAARAAKIGGPIMADSASIQSIKQIPGNGFCADCDQISKKIFELKYFLFQFLFRSNMDFIEPWCFNLYGLCIFTSKSWNTFITCSIIRT
jgi:hypothetical protein